MIEAFEEYKTFEKFLLSPYLFGPAVRHYSDRTGVLPDLPGRLKVRSDHASL